MRRGVERLEVCCIFDVILYIFKNLEKLVILIKNVWLFILIFSVLNVNKMIRRNIWRMGNFSLWFRGILGILLDVRDFGE